MSGQVQNGFQRNTTPSLLSCSSRLRCSALLCSSKSEMMLIAVTLKHTGHSQSDFFRTAHLKYTRNRAHAGSTVRAVFYKAWNFHFVPRERDACGFFVWLRVRFEQATCVTLTTTTTTLIDLFRTKKKHNNCRVKNKLERQNTMGLAKHKQQTRKRHNMYTNAHAHCAANICNIRHIGWKVRSIE